jgi:GGDEF domain-containing protein
MVVIVSKYPNKIRMPNIDSKEAIKIAESIRKKVAEHSFYGIEHMPQKRITVSIGVSTSLEMATKREQLIMLADQALYAFLSYTPSGCIGFFDKDSLCKMLDEEGWWLLFVT